MFDRKISPGSKGMVESKIRLPLNGCLPLLPTAGADPSVVQQLCIKAAAANDEDSDVAMELAHLIRPDLLNLFAP